MKVIKVFGIVFLFTMLVACNNPMSVTTEAPRATGNPVTVVYLGGSITCGMSATTPDYGYAANLVNWLRSRGHNVTSYNFGVYGTGALYGADRIDWQVVTKTPDILLVEYAVNDEGKDASLGGDVSFRAFEKIISYTRAHLPNCTIVIADSICATQYPVYLAGGLPTVVQEHRAIAAAYGCIYVPMGETLLQVVTASGQSMSAYIPDGVHPNNVGHMWYSTQIAAALSGLY